jgi:hypothetical protein
MLKKLKLKLLAFKEEIFATGLVVCTLINLNSNFQGTTVSAAVYDMKPVLTTSVQSAVTDTISYMSALLPIGLTVFAVVWGVKKAIRFFKGASN